jgi:hypothetical protein
VVAGGIFPKDEVEQQQLNFGQDWLQSLLLLSNGPELALHRHDIENNKKHA